MLFGSFQCLDKVVKKKKLRHSNFQFNCHIIMTTGLMCALKKAIMSCSHKVEIVENQKQDRIM